MVVPFVYFGAIYWGAEGVLIGQMMGGVIVAIISYLLAERLMRQAEANQISDPKERAFAKSQSAFKVLHQAFILKPGEHALNPLVRRVKRRIPIRIVRFWRST